LDVEGGGFKGGAGSLGESAGELAILLARRGDRGAREWIERTLREAQALRDVEHGGFYARSLDSARNEPPRERTLADQATAIRLYALGFLLFDDEEFLETASNTQRFVARFLKVKDGRYALALRGEGRDQRLSLDETFSRSGHAALVQALVALYAASGREEHVAQAVLVADASLAGAGGASSLAELVSVVDAYTALYSVSAERRWIELAQGAWKEARNKFASGASSCGRDPELTLRYVRTATSLGGYVGDVASQREAKDLLASCVLSSKAAASVRALYVMTHAEVDESATHVMIIGDKNNHQAEKLFRETLRAIPLHLQREWLDRREAPLPSRGVSYPHVSKPAVFVCSRGRCSLPLFTEQDVRETIAQVVP
jgi:uncharacterized protein YyaL (SSP411 family)